MKIRNLLVSITLAVLITGTFGLIGYIKRYSLWSGFELEAVDISAAAVMVVVLSAFLYLKVINR